MVLCVASCGQSRYGQGKAVGPPRTYSDRKGKENVPITVPLPSTPGGMLLGQALSEVLSGIDNGALKPPVRATVRSGGLEILVIDVGPNGPLSMRTQEVTQQMFPLTLEIRHSDGVEHVQISWPQSH